METAQALGDEASAKGVEALAALPHTVAIDAKDIDDLKRMGKHRLADSLANVKRMLDSSDFTLNMMSGMASFANMGDWAEGNTDGTNVISNAIASKPNINNPTAYNTYQVNWSSVAHREKTHENCATAFVYNFSKPAGPKITTSCGSLRLMGPWPLNST